ncbi:MAG: ribosome biogenesis GTPase Der [Candidatus Dasytiphilus stammeri]
MTLPIISLVGRSTVGKSTLFNQITNNKYEALVANIPKVTRDLKYGRSKIKGLDFIFIDTGGIEYKSTVFLSTIEKAVLLNFFHAIEQANLILLILDAEVGLMPGDVEIMNMIRFKNKPLLIVINKIDKINNNNIITDFFSLGLGKEKFFFIAAKKGKGIKKLLEEIFIYYKKFFPLKKKENLKKNQNIYTNKDYKKSIKIAIIGSPNVGKSTLINGLLGGTSTTQRLIVCNMPGTTRENIYIPIDFKGHQHILIDTAGINKPYKNKEIIDKLSLMQTKKAIFEANVVIIVVDPQHGVKKQDLLLLNHIIKIGRSLVCVINKWDLLSKEKQNSFKKNIFYRLGSINFIRIHFVSSLYRIGIKNIITSVSEANRSSNFRFSSKLLTFIMNKASEEHQPPMIGKHRIKLKYAHYGGANPHIIVIHGNQVKKISHNYKVYLKNYFHRALNIMGTPIQVIFKECLNPFILKKK